MDVTPEAAIGMLRHSLRYVDAPHEQRVTYGEAVSVLAHELERLRAELIESHTAHDKTGEEAERAEGERDAALAEQERLREALRQARDEEHDRILAILQEAERIDAKHDVRLPGDSALSVALWSMECAKGDRARAALASEPAPHALAESNAGVTLEAIAAGEKDISGASEPAQEESA